MKLFLPVRTDALSRVWRHQVPLEFSRLRDTSSIVFSGAFDGGLAGA